MLCFCEWTILFFHLEDRNESHTNARIVNPNQYQFGTEYISTIGNNNLGIVAGTHHRCPGGWVLFRAEVDAPAIILLLRVYAV